MSRYAVNVADCLHPELSMLVQLLLGPVTPGRERVKLGKNVDDFGVLLECGEERAQAICDLLARKARDLGLLVRCYREGPRGGWSPLPRIKAGGRR